VFIQSEDPEEIAREHRRPGVPMVCLETAQAAKFSETIVEAIGREPPRPATFAQLEAQPQRFEVLPVDARRVMDYIVTHAG